MRGSRIALLGLAVVVSGIAPPPTRGADWQAGAASVDITPRESVWLAGFAARKSPSTGVLRPIHAKALALRGQDGTTAVIVTIDVVGIRRPLTQRVKARIEAEHRIPAAAVVLVASHTHSAPLPMDSPDRLDTYKIDPKATAANIAWTNDLEAKLVNVVGAALKAFRPATLTYGTASAEFAMNRREPTASGIKNGLNPDGPTDRSVPVLKVVDAEGTPRAILFGYACHNTTLVSDNLRICGDYAGFAQEALEAAHPGCVALFATGCGADSNPQPRGKVEQAQRYGKGLADAVETVCERDGLTPLTGPLRYAAIEPSARFAGPTDRAAYEQRLTEPNAARQAHARRMIERIDKRQSIETEHPYAIQAFGIGERLTFLALAGEVVVDYAIRLQKELGGTEHPLWIAGYSNDVFGYIPSVRVLKEGGYEGGEAFYYSSYPTPFAEEIEEVIARGAREVVTKVRGR